MCSSVNKFGASAANSPFKMPNLEANPDLTSRVSESVGSLGVLNAVKSNQPFSFAGGNDLSSF